MKLFFSAGACSLSPHIVLRELGIPFDLIRANVRTKVLPDGSDYRTVNPKGQVPYLVLDDGQGISEGPVIVQYLADLAPERKLLPPVGTLERIRVQEWLNFITSELHKGFSPLFNPAMPEDAKTLFRQRLMERFQYVDEQLAGRSYLTGETFTVADAYLFVVSNWAAGMQVDITGFKNLAAFRERVTDRPSTQAALAAEKSAP